MIPVAGVVLAAGMSSRMGEENKLVKVWNDRPLVRHVVDACAQSQLDRFVVVTGHQQHEVEACLPSDVALIQNHEYEQGMAGSIRAGIYRLQGLAAVMVLLGDMPMVEPDHINAMINAFRERDETDAIVVATNEGKWGNPVLFGTAYFGRLKMLDGDRGARALLEENQEHIVPVEIGQAAARDFDTKADF